jgi:hypothetical protein
MSGKKCTICLSARRDEIDSRLAAGGRANSLRKVAADFGFGLRVVWSHSRHRRENSENASAGVTPQLRRLLADHRQLYRKAVRVRNLDVAARQLGAISDLELRLAASAPRAEDDTALPPDYRVAIREALGFTPTAARSGQAFDFRLVYDDSNPGDPHRENSHKTRRLTEEEFLRQVLTRSGWRSSLIEVLTFMLQYGNAPQPVRVAAADFLSVLSREDKDGHLGRVTNASNGDTESGESEEADGGDK